MNMKKKMKAFFTMNRHANEGFTLVELIVVIAILAILAGVAVPAYSGYIEKANRAADEQLLSAVNTAFAAACAFNGESNYGRNDDPSITINAGAVESRALNTANDAINLSFAEFFEGGTFNVFSQLAYDGAAGQFCEGTVVTFGNYQITISKELADALKDNTFSGLGADVLLGKVDKMSDIAAPLVDQFNEDGTPNGTFASMIFATDENGTLVYLTDLQKTLGMEPDEFASFITNADGTYNTNVLANSLVLNAAKKTEGMDTSFLGTPGSAAQLRSDLDDPNKATDAMAKLALTYGMYTSYMKSQGLADASQGLLDDNTFTGMTNVLGTIEGTQKPVGATMTFNEYLTSSQGQADLDAYMASMQIVNNSANQSPDAAKDILTGGFTDPDLVAALGSLMGS